MSIHASVLPEPAGIRSGAIWWLDAVDRLIGVAVEIRAGLLVVADVVTGMVHAMVAFLASLLGHVRGGLS